MWRPTFTILRKVILPSLKENVNITKILYSTRDRRPSSTAKITLISASVGVLVGAGYGGYTHYKVNVKKPYMIPAPGQNQEYAFLKEPPEYQPHYKVRPIITCLTLSNHAWLHLDLSLEWSYLRLFS